MVKSIFTPRLFLMLAGFMAGIIIFNSCKKENIDKSFSAKITGTALKKQDLSLKNKLLSSKTPLQKNDLYNYENGECYYKIVDFDFTIRTGPYFCCDEFYFKNITVRRLTDYANNFIKNREFSTYDDAFWGYQDLYFELERQAKNENCLIEPPNGIPGNALEKTCPNYGGGGNYGGGNNPPINNPPIIEVKQDSLQKYYPCMVKEILNKLMENATYGKLIQPFQKIQLPGGGTLNSLQGLPNLTFGFSSQTYGGTSNNYMLGKTISDGGRSSKIEFNSNAMNNSSKLFLQMATIHEVGHAYSTFYVKSGAYGYPVDTTKYSTWAMNIVSFEAAASSQSVNGNYTDHSLFLENYVDNFIKILKEVNGSSYTDKQYQMAAIYGLNNAGDPPPNSIFNGINLYNIYKGILEKSYANLLTKYGITTTERDAFYQDNLVNVPASKKLPTNCPN